MRFLIPDTLQHYAIGKRVDGHTQRWTIRNFALSLPVEIWYPSAVSVFRAPVT